MKHTLLLPGFKLSYLLGDISEIYVLDVYKSMRYLFLTNSVFFLRDGIHAPGTSS